MHCWAVMGRSTALLALIAMSVAAAAQTNRLPRIGYVMSGTVDGSRHLVEAMRAGLADEGVVDGQGVVLEIRYLEGRTDRYSEVFADILRNPVDLLGAAGPVGIRAARDASDGRIPVSGYGGLLSYGSSNIEGFRQFGRYAARLIRGAKPADLPIWHPMRFEFIVNQKSARSLGIKIPSSVLMRADRVIE